MSASALPYLLAPKGETGYNKKKRPSDRKELCIADFAYLRPAHWKKPERF
jgi:hypothetical protein